MARKPRLEQRQREAHRVRYNTIARYVLGHGAEIEPTCDPSTITVRVGKELFTDARKLFPTEQLLARVTLAVMSTGGSYDIGDLDDEDVLRTLDRTTIHGDGNG